jgi:gentisate 1,2-dioxygenase
VSTIENGPETGARQRSDEKEDLQCLELSDIQSSPEELRDYYAQLRAQHVTPAWISGGISIEPRSEAVPYLWHWRDLRPQAMRAAQLVGTEMDG